MKASAAWPASQEGPPPALTAPLTHFAIPAPGRTRAQPAAFADSESGDSMFAALDLGTNNCRLMIAARAGARFRVVESFSRIVRLGEGLQQTGSLSDAAMARTIEALRVCATRLERKRPAGFRAVATEACRRASNGAAFLERVRQETGIDISIITGREEAELAVESCANLLHDSSHGEAATRGLLIDIGGGSTEIAWVRIDPQRHTHEVISYLSLPVGVITLAEQFSQQADSYPEMVAHVQDHLTRFEEVHCIRREIRRGHVRLVGTSGTVTTLASLALDLPRYIRPAIDGFHLAADEARAAIERLHRMGNAGMRVHPCIGAERATYVMPGCAIFEAIHSLWPTDVIVADRGLRDGMLLRMMRAQPTSRRPAQGRQHDNTPIILSDQEHVSV